MSPRLPNPLDRLLVLPAEAMAGHTAVLSEMSATMDRRALHQAVGPLGRIAGRLRGQRHE